ncbi:hypothetical protein NODU109028_13660 [Nocardioides dubius]|uniref:hypothetical protein n=1 Tax=Nocardioides dubius TaxID=317019 RepID=UPI0031D59280
MSQQRLPRSAPGGDLVAAVADLWPSAVPGQESGPVQARFCVVPAAGGVGTALPLDSPRASARAVRRFNAAATTPAVAKRLMLAAALRMGAGRLLPASFEVAGPDTDSLARLLDTVFGEPVTFSVAIGTARVNRKRVLEVFGERGDTLGFVKLGGSSVSDADVAAEAAALPHLTTSALPGLSVPQVLWSGSWRGAQLLVITAVPQSPRQRRVDRRDPPLPEIAELTDAFAEGPFALTTSGWWERTESRLAALADESRRVRALACLEVLGARADEPVPFAAWHGDWTPWNMARHLGGLSLWDWERFSTGVPAGLDVWHYLLNARLAGALEPETALAVLRDGESFWRALGERVAHDPEVGIGMYLAEILARYLPLAEGAGGDVILSRTDALLTAWEAWASAQR